jgi:aspartate aminotransferase
MSELSISRRGKEMPESPIRKLVPYAEAAVARGTKVYYLNIGQPDIETPPQIVKAVADAHLRVLEYSHSAGNESYRKKLAQYYRRLGIENIDYSNILITTGGSEALLFSFMACCDAGDEIIIPEPFYANYNGFAVEAGVKIIPIPSSIESGFALPPAADFEKKITAKTKAIVLCNPNNPTGYLYSREELETLKNIALKHGLYLISDEAYSVFCYEGEHCSVLKLKGADDNIVFVDTISKRYSACGARIGAFVTRNKNLVPIVLKLAQARLSPPGLAQILGEAATDLPADYFEQTRAEYKHRRDILVKRLTAMEGVYCPKPGGAFYVMAKLPVDDSEKFCRWLLEKFSYQGQTLMMAPAPGFYATKGLGRNEVRLAYVLKTEDIEKAMDCLEIALKEYAKLS